MRLAEGRMFYLLNDDRPEQPYRKCFDCGHTTNPREAETCSRCSHSLKERRFLLSVRWDPRFFSAYQEFFARGLVHPGMVQPVEVFLQDNVLCSICVYRGESLLLDECSPLGMAEMQRFSQRVLGLSAFLQHNGVVLNRLSPANFLVDTSNNVLLYDLDVKGVQSGPLDAEDRRTALGQVARLWRRYAPIHGDDLWDIVHKAEAGEYVEPGAMGDPLQALFDDWEKLPPPPTSTALTDVGLVRDLNEDNWAWTQLADNIFLYVVADGMGGHDSGEVASELASRTLCEVARRRSEDTKNVSPEYLENVLDEAFQSANNTVKENAENRGNDMGTTLVALLVVEGRLALIANVGDSRGYLLRDKVLHKVTRDHSLVQRMVEQNRITEEEARNHPHSNILLRTVGTERNVEIDIYAVEIEKGDRVLLCSDGLWGEVEDDDIEAILNHYQDLRVASRELVRAAHHGGGRDNITLVLVENS